MQLKRQSVEAWQNENHYSKGNNTSENPIPRQEIFKPVDHVKYEGQVRSQHLLLMQFLTNLGSLYGQDGSKPVNKSVVSSKPVSKHLLAVMCS